MERRHNPDRAGDPNQREITPTSSTAGDRQAATRAARDRSRRVENDQDLARRLDRMLLRIVIEYDQPTNGAESAAGDSGHVSPAEGTIGAVVDCRESRVDVRVPMPLVHGLLKLTRFLPQSWRDKAAESLSDRGMLARAAEGRTADERVMDHLTRLNIDVRTETRRVHIWADTAGDGHG